jgi:hypothetical protein
MGASNRHCGLLIAIFLVPIIIIIYSTSFELLGLTYHVCYLCEVTVDNVRSFFLAFFLLLNHMFTSLFASLYLLSLSCLYTCTKSNRKASLAGKGIVETNDMAQYTLASNFTLPGTASVDDESESDEEMDGDGPHGDEKLSLYDNTNQFEVSAQHHDVDDDDDHDDDKEEVLIDSSTKERIGGGGGDGYLNIDAE